MITLICNATVVVNKVLLWSFYLEHSTSKFGISHIVQSSSAIFFCAHSSLLRALVCGTSLLVSCHQNLFIDLTKLEI